MIDDDDFGSEWCVIIRGESVSDSIETLSIVHEHPVVTQGFAIWIRRAKWDLSNICLLYTSPSPRDGLLSRMPSSA